MPRCLDAQETFFIAARECPRLGSNERFHRRKLDLVVQTTDSRLGDPKVIGEFGGTPVSPEIVGTTIRADADQIIINADLF